MNVQDYFDENLGSTTIKRSSVVVFAVGVFTLLLIIHVNFSSQSKVTRPIAGCRKISSPANSSLVDEFDPKYNPPQEEATKDNNPAARIKGIFVHPIKSCRRVEVDEIEIEEKGCKYDRDFIIAQSITKEDDETKETNSAWQFITLRAFPMMAHIEIELWEPDTTAPGYAPDAQYVQSGGCLVISFPRVVDAKFTSISGFGALLANLPDIVYRMTLKPWSRESFILPYNPTESQIERFGLRAQEVKLWGDWPAGIDMGNCIPKDILAELGKFLHIKNPLTILRKDPRAIREVHGNADDIQDLGYQANASFADSFPINILGISSVQEVASKLPNDAIKLSAARFRSNFLIAGSPPFAEESWKSISISDGPNNSPMLFHVTNRCHRCNLPNVDPHQEDPRKRNVVKYGQTGYNEPLKTLRSHRAVDEGAPGNPCLGMMVVPSIEAVGKKIRVGMAIHVEKEGKHIYKS